MEEALNTAALRASSHGGFSELFSADGALREDWQPLVSHFLPMTKGVRAAQIEQIKRARAESGITFDPYAEAEVAGLGQRDICPVVFGAAEWRTIEAGLCQRAALIEATLRDLYGRGLAVRRGAIPAALVHGTGGFLKHCSGWEQPPERWLYQYSCDLVRGRDGAWYVLNDKVDTPVSDGWALANRVAFGRCFDLDGFGGAVRRLASHYEARRALLERHMTGTGTAALITPGPSDAQYFSHAYIARYLDATLVEPGDLTSRGGGVHIKTLDGLKPVSVMLRAVASAQLDALFRPHDAIAGATTLTGPVRDRAAIMANALGSGVLEHRALAPFAAALCRTHLNEDPLFGERPSLWLGEAGAVDRYLDERSAWSLGGVLDPDLRPDLPEGASTDTLRRYLRREGARFVATKPVAAATTLSVTARETTLKPYVLRTFVAATPDGFEVLPGGQAFVVSDEDSIPPRFGFGKDVWVRADAGRARQVSVISKQVESAHLRRTGRALLSRVADNLFWLGRNMERLETKLRVLKVVVERMIDGSRLDRDPALLLQFLAPHLDEKTRARLSDQDPRKALEQTLDYLTRRDTSPGGVLSTLDALYNSAAHSRSHISREAWRYVVSLCSDHGWRSASEWSSIGSLSVAIDDSLRNVAAFAGSIHENLSRNYAWRFLEMGRRLERGVETAKIAEGFACCAPEDEPRFLGTWLELSDSLSIYRGRYAITPAAAPTLDLLILDESNPRSIAYQLTTLEGILHELGNARANRNDAERNVIWLRSKLRVQDAVVLGTRRDGGDGRYVALGSLARRIRMSLEKLSNDAQRSFFAHATAPVALTSGARLGLD